METIQKPMCPKHPKYPIEYIQTGNLKQNSQNQQNKSLFYCIICADSDSSFRSPNYQLISQILEDGDNKVFLKWHPNNNSTQILQTLIDFPENKDHFNKIENEIVEFFVSFKKDINNEIDIIQKKMVQIAFNSSRITSDILLQYQNISRIQELRSILINQEDSFDEKLKKYITLSQDMLKKQQEISNQLSQILKDAEQKNKNKIYSKEASRLKSTLLNTIQNINIFSSPLISKKQFIQTKKDMELISASFNANEGEQLQQSQRTHTEYSFALKNESKGFNIISKDILGIKTKYIFRFSIENMSIGNILFLGVMDDKNSNIKYGFEDNFSIALLKSNNQIKLTHEYSQGLIKKWNIKGFQHFKGQEFSLLDDDLIEMKICVKDGIFEISDYPQYRSTLTINSSEFSKLIYPRLYVGLVYPKNTVTLKETFVVNEFY